MELQSKRFKFALETNIIHSLSVIECQCLAQNNAKINSKTNCEKSFLVSVTFEFKRLRINMRGAAMVIRGNLALAV
jgi:hypothetical protein